MRTIATMQQTLPDPGRVVPASTSSVCLLTDDAVRNAERIQRHAMCRAYCVSQVHITRASQTRACEANDLLWIRSSAAARNNWCVWWRAHVRTRRRYAPDRDNLPSATYEVHGNGSQERRRRCRAFWPIAPTPQCPSVMCAWSMAALRCAYRSSVAEFIGRLHKFGIGSVVIRLSQSNRWAFAIAGRGTPVPRRRMIADRMNTCGSVRVAQPNLIDASRYVAGRALAAWSGYDQLTNREAARGSPDPSHGHWPA